MVSVSLLDAMAHAELVYPLNDHNPLLIPAIDAKKQRWYAACYHSGKRLGQFLDLSINDLANQAVGDSIDRPMVFLGPAAEFLCQQARLSQPASTWAWRTAAWGNWAQALLELGKDRLAAGNWDNADEGPEYVRSSDAEIGITLKSEVDLPGKAQVTGAT
jgi:tRNA threonylcarbamoyladenosine biosynthesis protein TsaB